jgi:hypothetical protein
MERNKQFSLHKNIQSPKLEENYCAVVGYNKHITTEFTYTINITVFTKKNRQTKQSLTLNPKSFKHYFIKYLPWPLSTHFFRKDGYEVQCYRI